MNKNFTFTFYKRYFTLTFGNYTLLDEFVLDLEYILKPLVVYKEDEGEYLKLYYSKNLTYWIPTEVFLSKVLSLLKSRYPNREDYALLRLNRYKSISLGDVKISSKYQLRDYQQQYHDLITEGKEDSIFVDLRTGSGKASWKESYVLTRVGHIKLEEIKVGYEVLNQNGFSKVTAVHPQGKQKLYKLKLANGMEHVCTLDHHWEIEYEDGNAEVVKTEKILTLLEEGKKLYIHSFLPDGYIKPMLHDDHGLIYAMTNEVEDRVSKAALEAMREELKYQFDPNRLNTILHSLALLTPITRYVILCGLIDMIETEVTLVDIGIYRVKIPLRDDLGKCVLPLKSLIYNMLPPMSKILQEDYNMKYDIEYVSQPYVITKSCNKYLCFNIDVDMVTLQEASYHLKQAVMDRLKSNLILLDSIRRQRKSALSGMMIKTEVESVEYEMEDEAICIEIEDPEGLYIVDEGIVTHNSFISTCAAVTRKMKVGMVVLPRYLEKWKEDYLEYTNLKESQIYLVQGKDSLLSLLKDHKYKDYEVILFSVRTLYNLWKDYEAGIESISPFELFKNLGIGTLISDESHQELNAIFKILIYSDVDKLIGMSATYLSSRNDEKFVQSILFPESCRASNLIKFDNHIEYVDCPYTLDTTGGAIKCKLKHGYSHILYEQGILKLYKLKNNYFRMVCNLIKEDFISRRKKGEKCLVYFNLVAMCSEFVHYLREDEELKKLKLDVRKYTQEDDYSTIKVADIIVSTLQSLSTAFTVPNLISVYNTVSVKSVKMNLQSMGRLRKLEGRETKFFNLYAVNYPVHKLNAKERIKQSQEHVKSVIVKDLGFISKFV